MIEAVLMNMDKMQQQKLDFKSIWVVVPAYNAASSIGDVVCNSLRYVDGVVVVDDLSVDNTIMAAQNAGAIVIRHTLNIGAGAATRTGCDFACKCGADCIVTLDADGQHDPEDIPKLLSCLKDEGFEIVFGYRLRDKNMPLHKRVGNAGLSLIARILFKVDIYDSQTGFHAFTKNSYKKLRWESDRYGVVSEFVMRVGKYNMQYGQVLVKTIYKEKKEGMGVLDAFNSVILMLKWRLNKYKKN